MQVGGRSALSLEAHHTHEMGCKGSPLGAMTPRRATVDPRRNPLTVDRDHSSVGGYQVRLLTLIVSWVWAGA